MLDSTRLVESRAYYKTHRDCVFLRNEKVKIIHFFGTKN